MSDSRHDFRQLELNITPQGEPLTPVEIPKPSYTHGVVANPVARGIYYRYWWIDSEGKTHGRYIRGGAVDTNIGEARRFQVLTLIDAGLSPYQIGLFLDRLPRSKRRSRHVNFEKYMEEKN